MKIGTKIKAKFAYARKASDRFTGSYDKPMELKPKVTNFIGYVIGERWQIMSNFIYNHGGRDEPSYVTGTKEKVLLVVKSLRNNPVVVRIQDLE